MNKALLVILDGWGYGPTPSSDAILNGQTPFFDSLLSQYPNSTLITHGEQVGLPDGQMGNSEVGHMNIGAGRIVFQELARINNAIKDGSMAQNKGLLEAIEHAKTHQKPIHLLGLVSDGGIHSHINHLKALVDIIEANGHHQNYIHALTDGRDTDPKSGVGFMEELDEFLSDKSTKIASVCGRYYSMDRDKRWPRIKLGFDLLTKGIGSPYQNAAEGLRAAYAEGITDEFIKPIVLTEHNQPIATIQEGDVVLAFNFRTDRLRQMTTVLTQQDFSEDGMQTIPLYYVTMTNYDDSFQNIHVLFSKDDIQMTLGEYVSQQGGTQVRVAETEKYAHVTFFFSGGREKPFDGENRILIPSPKVETYDLQPEMSAIEVTDTTIEFIKNNLPDLIVLNYANTDMVGHTGVFEAAMKAAVTVDQSLERLVNTALEHDYRAVIIADHGNSDYMINEDGSPNTAHTKNPVPCIVISPNPESYQVKDGKLADVAPTILKLMNIRQPGEMTGECLIESKMTKN